MAQHAPGSAQTYPRPAGSFHSTTGLPPLLKIACSCLGNWGISRPSRAFSDRLGRPRTGSSVLGGTTGGPMKDTSTLAWVQAGNRTSAFICKQAPAKACVVLLLLVQFGSRGGVRRDARIRARLFHKASSVRQRGPSWCVSRCRRAGCLDGGVVVTPSGRSPGPFRVLRSLSGGCGASAGCGWR
jgi:hypothetical protein